MSSTADHNHASELRRIIAQVRRRWRLRHALRGSAIALAAGAVAFWLAAYIADRPTATAQAILATRFTIGLTVATLIGWFVLRPLLRRVSDERVALYVEENEPTLHAALLGAIEAMREGRDNRGDHSPALVARLVQVAVDRCREIEDGRRIEDRRLKQSWAAFGGVAAAVLLAFLSGPAFVREGGSRLLMPAAAIEAATAMRIAVQPGSDTIPRGADFAIKAELFGFRSEEVEIIARSTDGAERRWRMLPGAENRFEFVLFDVNEPLEYRVVSGTIESPTYRLEVADLPYVGTLELEYIFPAYTGLPPQTVPDGGDIAVPVGTIVNVKATPTMAVPSGRIILDDARAIAMQRSEDGALTGRMRIDKDGFYHIELPGPNGQKVQGTQQYAIAALADNAPGVVITKPGRDSKATVVEEVYIEARADDDYGVQRLELVYSVNGGPRKTVPLYSANGRATKEISAGHTFYLEEMDLKPGDFVSYFARAVDTNPAADAKEKTTDIYFLEIRPFGREYRQAEQGGQPPPGGGGGGGQQDSELSQQQREIIAATFNVVRDRDTYRPQALSEHINTIALAQERLREQVQTLAERMRNRGVAEMDTLFEQIMLLLPQAAREMEPATRWLRRELPDSALAPEQRALQFLLRAEALYREVQVAQQQGGGGGGGGRQAAEDLADLFELELDKLRNQYETVQRSAAEQNQAEVDETMERLRELARRQQQEIERQRRAGQQQSGGGGGSAAQRQLAEETEEEARRLERLARERNSQELQEAARRLQDAADAMRRASANGQQGAAQGASALDRLEEAQRRLQRSRKDALANSAADAARRAQELLDEQRRIAGAVGRLGDNPTRDQLRELTERKNQLNQGVAGLERELDRLAAESRQNQREASRKLQDAANAIRENRVKELIRFSQDAISARQSDYAQAIEQQIAQELERVRRQVADAAGSVSETPQERMADALDRTRSLVNGLQSLEERLRDRQESGPAGARGSAQDSSRNGQQRDRRGLSARQGENAEQAGQQGQQQGQQGQQGQGGEQSQGGQQGGQQGRMGDQGGPGGENRFGGYAGGRVGPGGVNAPLTAEELRQYENELRQRIDDAESIIRELRAQGQDVTPLENAVRNLRAFDRQNILRNPDGLNRLQADVIEGLKEFEFAMRRQIQGSDRERLYLNGSDQVPPTFRKMVEEYYRSLSTRRPDR